MNTFIQELESQATTPELKTILLRIKDDYSSFQKVRQEYLDAKFRHEFLDEYKNS